MRMVVSLTPGAYCRDDAPAAVAPRPERPLPRPAATPATPAPAAPGPAAADRPVAAVSLPGTALASVELDRPVPEVRRLVRSGVVAPAATTASTRQRAATAPSWPLQFTPAILRHRA